MHAPITPPSKTRLGFHYYPDTYHYRESDLHAWLPELQSLGAAWLVLIAPPDRAIPEAFLAGLLEAGIEPVLHFPLPLGEVLGHRNPAQAEGLRLLFHSYASWGVHYAVLFDRPNNRAAWPAGDWAQAELVERFLDLYLPLAGDALQAGLTPVFPPLEPGGDYWDTAFLRAALQGMQRRGHDRLLRSLVLSAYARLENQPLNWGAGGPERWPGARPYFTPTGQQDQRGFYIFDWYLTLAKAVLGAPRPILLLGAGSRVQENPDPAAFEHLLTVHAQENLALTRLLASESEGPQPVFPAGLAGSILGHSLDSVPPEVLACNFWLLAAESDSPQAVQAWFQPGGNTLPVIEALRHWHSKRIAPTSPEEEPASPAPEDLPEEEPQPEAPAYPIAHYLLLPTYSWGIADWQIDAIKPFVRKYRPTIGFSLDEAACAARVTIVGGEQAFPAEALEKLATAGCQVDRIAGDGTSIASQLASR